MTSPKLFGAYRGEMQTGWQPRSGGPGRTLDQLRLRTFFFPPHLHGIPDVPPWGIVVPEEALVAREVTYIAEMDAHRVPPGSTFLLRFAPEDGVGVQEVRVPFNGPDPLVHIVLPLEWFQPAVGKRVAIDYSVEWPDGVRYPGPGINVNVKPMLQVGDFLLEGLATDAPLDPAAFPNGIASTLKRISNIESYSKPRLQWAVNATPPGEVGGLVVTIATFRYEINGLADHDFHVTIPPQAYSGYYEQGYTEVYVGVMLMARSIPADVPGLEFYYQLDYHSVLPPSR